MRGIVTLLVLSSLLVIALIVGIPVMDTMLPISTDMAPAYTSQLTNIHEVVVKWVIPVFFATTIMWAVFWILRTERQQVR